MRLVSRVGSLRRVYSAAGGDLELFDESPPPSPPASAAARTTAVAMTAVMKNVFRLTPQMVLGSWSW